MYVLKQILAQSFLVLFCVGGTAGILLGVTILLKPGRVALLNELFSRWIGPHKLKEQLDRPRWIERYVYRHHRIAGAFLFLGALFVFFVFSLGQEERRLAAMLPAAIRWLWDVLRLMILVGSVLGVIVGNLVFIRPSLLRDFEKSSNRWVSTEKAMNTFDVVHGSFDRQVLRYSKAAGAFMVLGGAYVLIVLGQLLWHGNWRF